MEILAGTACTVECKCWSRVCVSNKCAAAASASNARSCTPGQVATGAGGICQSCPLNSTCTCPTGTSADGSGGCVASNTGTPASPAAGTSTPPDPNIAYCTDNGGTWKNNRCNFGPVQMCGKFPC